MAFSTKDVSVFLQQRICELELWYFALKTLNKPLVTDFININLKKYSTKSRISRSCNLSRYQWKDVRPCCFRIRVVNWLDRIYTIKLYFALWFALWTESKFSKSPLWAKYMYIYFSRPEFLIRSKMAYPTKDVSAVLQQRIKYASWSFNISLSRHWTSVWLLFSSTTI